MKRIFLFLLCTTWLLHPSAEADTVRFKADSMSGTAGSKTVLTGHAVMSLSSLEIQADTIELTGTDSRYIQAHGNVRGKNTSNNIDFSCGNLSYDRMTKIAILKDHVALVDEENDTVAHAEFMEYQEQKDVVIMQIDVDVTQKNNTCQSAYALYYKTTKMLFLQGNAQIAQGDDLFRAQEISLNLETQEVRLDGRVRGTVTNKEEKNE